ncbi:MAG TPA: MoaD/ThiS family protein [bacterium]|nr:MoaD/ThiS family protein [bacterium]
MRVKVLLFAGLRERAGRGEMDLELEPGVTVREVPGRVFGAEMVIPPKSLRYAVNQDYVSETQALREGDEVALIPPVAGG